MSFLAPLAGGLIGLLGSSKPKATPMQQLQSAMAKQYMPGTYSQLWNDANATGLSPALRTQWQQQQGITNTAYNQALAALAQNMGNRGLTNSSFNTNAQYGLAAQKASTLGNQYGSLMQQADANRRNALAMLMSGTGNAAQSAQAAELEQQRIAQQQQAGLSASLGQLAMYYAMNRNALGPKAPGNDLLMGRMPYGYGSPEEAYRSLGYGVDNGATLRNISGGLPQIGDYADNRLVIPVGIPRVY